MWTTSDKKKNLADYIANNYSKKKNDHVKKNNLSLKKYLRIKIEKKRKKKVFKWCEIIDNEMYGTFWNSLVKIDKSMFWLAILHIKMYKPSRVLLACIF
jgi:hypothetical protein